MNVGKREGRSDARGLELVNGRAALGGDHLFL